MRWRHMFYLTGLPGWMRFGYSPGWGGIPPGAAYLMQSGQYQDFLSWLSSQGTWFRPWGWGPWGWAPPSREQELAWLEAQARALEAQLKAIKDRLEELSKEEK
ncbi:DUF5320 domain-containing protein [Candidatus Bipolaricaulota sp. J31]